MEDREFKKYYRKNLAIKPAKKRTLNEGATWENRKSGEPLPTMADYKEAYDKKNVQEGPMEDFEDEEFEAHSSTLENPDGVYVALRTDVLATIDELNQYLNGNVTKDSLMETLNELVLTLEEF